MWQEPWLLGTPEPLLESCSLSVLARDYLWCRVSVGQGVWGPEPRLEVGPSLSSGPQILEPDLKKKW